MLDFRTRTFLTVCKYMNYTKAAEELCITQPAVSQHIKFLETDYKAKLFYYEGKKLALTPAGELFYKKLATIAYDDQILRKRMLEDSKSVMHLNFGATRTIGEFYLTDKLTQFLAENPSVQLSMIVENTAYLLDKLQKGEIDFALLEGYFPKTEYSFLPYAREEYICVAAPNYPFKQTPHLLEDLLTETLIIREAGSGTRAILEKNLENQNLGVNDFKQLVEIGNIHVLKKLVINNLGITTLYKTAVTEELTNSQLCQVNIEDLQKTHDFYFVWRKNSVFSDLYKQIAQSF
ncbi:LysR family transcriptional regulator [Tetragenococcus halophilus]|uniref:LysR family transcriptional regulator n=1 Tax=Tetragenococcus halophilus TaxID=51669 RepID=A0AB35HMH0_TETHA|nr:LysR family transcriptional regulator [Tetragenococcus halophilus]MCO8297431.1 LysR family transcriptional regulator [Tetragenococcus halophilus]